MTKLEKFEKAIAELSDEERNKLRAFLDGLDWQARDRQIERDAAEGKLDAIEARARANLQTGKVRDL